MEYLVLMTIAGGALCLAFWAWERLFHNSLTQCIRYRALKFVLLVYVVPWVWLKDIYGYVIRWLLPVSVQMVTEHPIAMADIITEEEAYTTLDYRWHLLIVAIWLLVALSLVIRKSKIYFREKNKYLSTAVEIDADGVRETMELLRKELHYGGRIEIYQTPFKGNTLTLGAIRPIIFLQEECTGEELYFVLKHEMIHIVRRDLVLKLILEFACCLHWFNYLAHALNGIFDDMCEKACDERVLEGCSQETYKAYARVLADSFSRHKESGLINRIPFHNSFDNGVEQMMERINALINAKNIKRWKKGMAESAFALLVIANSFSAMAYPDVYHVQDGNKKLAESVIEGDAFWAYDEVEVEYDENILEVQYDKEFIDEEGYIYPVNMNICDRICAEHNVISGNYQVHLRNDNDSCTVEIYEATMCTICDSIWQGEFVSITKWEQCPH